MSNELQVLVAGKAESSLERLRSLVARVAGIEVNSLLMVNGNADPLVGVIDRPDIVILQTDGGVESLQAISRRPREERPLLLVVGDTPAPEAVKFAVRAGARDLVSESDPDALIAALEDAIRECRANRSEGDVISVINAKGGSGGTFLACSLAHMCLLNDESCLVLDLDFQFAPLPYYFDVTPKRSILDALANASALDGVALEAYVVKHHSGVSIMAPMPDAVPAVDFDVADRIRNLVPILRSRFRHTIVDVPRHVDEISAPVLKASDKVVIVVQQSLPAVRDAVRLKTTLVRELGIEKKRIRVLVNRHVKAGSIGLEDVREALGEDRLMLVPNHFKSVAQSVDLGVPIAELAPSSPVVKALHRIHAQLFGDPGGSGLLPTGNDAIRRLKQWSPF